MAVKSDESIPTEFQRGSALTQKGEFYGEIILRGRHPGDLDRVHVDFVSCGSSNSPSSPAATATPTATFTATPNPNSVLIIYGSNPTIVTNIGNLIAANGYTSTSVNMPSLVSGGTFNFSSYGKIIITNDTATTSPWGSTAIVNQIKASGAPILGLGEGGALFFDTAGDTEIGYGDSQNGTGTTVGPQNTTASL